MIGILTRKFVGKRQELGAGSFAGAVEGVKGGGGEWVYAGSGTYESTQTWDPTYPAASLITIPTGKTKVTKLSFKLNTVGSATAGKICLYDSTYATVLALQGFTPATDWNDVVVNVNVTAGLQYMIMANLDAADATIYKETTTSSLYCDGTVYCVYVTFAGGSNEGHISAWVDNTAAYRIWVE